MEIVARALQADGYELHDDGTKPSMVDALLRVGASVIALEVTSAHDDGWPAASSTMAELAVVQPAQRLEHDWGVRARTPQFRRDWVTTVSNLFPRNEQRLLQFPDCGGGLSASRTVVTDELEALGVRWCHNFGPARDRDGGYLYFMHGDGGPTEWATNAIERLLTTSTDNQDKLKKHTADERHLFVHLSASSGASLERLYLGREECPRDPLGVIDTLWIHSKWDLKWVYRLTPATRCWARYESATGQESPPLT